MINIKEDQLFRELGLTRRKVRWNRERNDISHHFLEVVLKDNQLKMSLECQKHWGKGQGNTLLNVGVVRKITCTNIALIEVK
jgi:hypothetical protein